MFFTQVIVLVYQYTVPRYRYVPCS